VVAATRARWTGCARRGRSEAASPAVLNSADAVGSGRHPVAMDFEHSERSQHYIKQVERLVRERVLPSEPTYVAQLAHSDDWRRWRIPPVLEQLKAEAKAAGLWNLFLPESELGAGLTNLEYAPLCEIMGRSEIAPEVFNCNAPDTGNMEVLARYGTPEQQERWLKPLLAGEIRSCFAMTEPGVASSDATNIESRIVRDGDSYVINGRKWWTTGAPDPRCRIAIFIAGTRFTQHNSCCLPPLP
jgi:acyl-CoA dehydrogenase